ncbi:glycosyl transferase [Pectobacterium carotovorum]|uniref:glycosyl transferase n=1 Tax=Pectobacterium carotovorum TaxID=554 RepID=UPI0015DEA497|nr:glycosyl transferase [Pectobacterium carotovorum]MBA0178565.1 glycosyl transferase [Pectobacterium carotovorum]
MVLYNCSIENSSTITSIFNTITDETNINLLIWNNGDTILNERDLNKYLHRCKQKKIATEIYQDTRNLSLSKIYNYFINKNSYHFISIFDQDTNIEKYFFKNIKDNMGYDIICPEVYLSNKENVKSSPVYNKAKVNTDFVDVGGFNARSIFTCASGVTLSLRLIKSISDKYGFVFNETYAFYWADHDLFERLRAFEFIKGMCIGKISHDMSGVGNEFEKMKEPTKLEHGYGQILRRIYNDNKSGLLQNFIYAIKFSVREKCSIKSSIKIIQCALFKAHPRSKNKIRKETRPTHQLYPK